MIRDPQDNEIEMAVVKKNEKVYFSDGWEVLQRFYKIYEAAWLTLVYANRHLFLFELRNMHGEELLYPHFNPPQRILLQHQKTCDYRDSFVRFGSNNHFLPSTFTHLIVI